MSLTPDGRVTIPVDINQCKLELLGGYHSATLERWLLALCEEIEQLRATKPVIAYGVLNDQGYWAGIYHERETAELVISKGQAAHHEQLVALTEVK